MSSKSILVVDDDKVILGTLKEILQSQGYRADTAETGREAIEKSKTQFYNLAILDIKLPDMDGTKLIKKMHETFPKMMKVMLTGYPSLYNAIESLNLGADAYLTKPIKPEEVLMVCEEKLREQEESKDMNQEKVKKWIETKVQDLRQKT